MFSSPRINILDKLIGNVVVHNYICSVKAIHGCFGPIIEVNSESKSIKYVIWITSKKAYDMVYEYGNFHPFPPKSGMQKIIMLNKDISDSWSSPDMEQYVEQTRSELFSNSSKTSLYYCFHGKLLFVLYCCSMWIDTFLTFIFDL